MIKKNVTIVPLRLRLARNFWVQCGAERALRTWFSKEWRRLPERMPRFSAYGFRGDLATAYIGQFRILLTDQPELRHLPKLVDADRNSQGLYSVWAEPESKTAEPMYLLVHDGWDGSCHLITYDAARAFVAAHRVLSTPIKGDAHDQMLP